MPIKLPDIRFNRYLPKSLFGRTLLIIILPVVIMQTVVAYIFFEAHWQTVTASLAKNVAANIYIATDLYKQSPGAPRTEQLDALLRPHMELSIALEPNVHLPVHNRKVMVSNLDKTLRQALQEILNDPFWIDTTRYPNYIDIRVAVNEGVLRFIVPRERVFAPSAFVFVFWLLMATILLTLISILFIRDQARPIAELAHAAEAFGRGQDIINFKPSGAAEVRLAGQSFLKMRQRIRRYIEQRTLMLAGVSHDLRTPLTRLKLHLALQAGHEEHKAAQQDVMDMENMLQAYLDFARADSEETSVPIHIGSYLQTLIAAYEPNKPEFYIHTRKDLLTIKPNAFKRAIENLLNNGFKYAQTVQIHLTRSKSDFYIHVDDDGPGIDVSKRKNAFKPFHRLDTARNLNIQGSGLGLAIVRDICQSHGGRLILDDSPLGGLRASLQLPV